MKKRRVTRLLATGLAIVMGGSLLAGCGGQDTQTADGTDGKMVLELWTSNREILDNDDAFYVNKLEEDFDVDIQLKYRNEGSSDYQEWLTLSLAGGDAPEWFRDQAITVQLLTDYAEQGLLAELDPEMVKENMPNLMAYYEKYSDIFGSDPLSLYAVDGKIYSIPDAVPSLSRFCLMAVRQDWLDNLNMEMPETLDEFTEVIKAFSENDPDGNGIKDTYGYIGINGTPTDAFSPIFGAFGVYPGMFYDDGTGKITRGELDVEQMKKALTYIKEICDAGYVDPEWMTVDYAGSQNKVVSSVVGICWQNWLSIQTADGWYAALFDTVPEAELSVSSGPVGENGEQGILQFNPLAGVGLVFTKKMEEQPEKLAKYMQVFDAIAGNPEYYEAEVWGVEGETFTVDEEGDRHYTEEYEDEGARLAYGIGTSYAFPSLEVFQYDPDVHDSITYDKATNDARAATIDTIKGKYNVLGSYYLPVMTELSAEMPDLGVVLTEFITGARDIEEYDDYVADWYAQGGDRIMEEAQETYEKYFK